MQRLETLQSLPARQASQPCILHWTSAPARNHSNGGLRRKPKPLALNHGSKPASSVPRNPPCLESSVACQMSCRAKPRHSAATRSYTYPTSGMKGMVIPPNYHMFHTASLWAFLAPPAPHLKPMGPQCTRLRGTGRHRAPIREVRGRQPPKPARIGGPLDRKTYRNRIVRKALK
jgi:hypothetical protein